MTKNNLAQRVSDETSLTIKNAVADVLKITQEVEPFEKPVTVRESFETSSLPSLGSSAAIASALSPVLPVLPIVPVVPVTSVT